DNIRLQMRLARRLDSKRLEILLSRLGLQNRRNSMPRTVSGGEAARAGLAVALAAAPAVLLADEPTGEVDAETEDRLITLLADECKGGMAALIATHSPAVASRADRVVHIADGMIVAATNGEIGDGAASS
ncbi:MAG: ATP-binding cassette domain-containing protein, partial [Acetobacteraceae bacterium]